MSGATSTTRTLTHPSGAFVVRSGGHRLVYPSQQAFLDAAGACGHIDRATSQRDCCRAALAFVGLPEFAFGDETPGRPVDLLAEAERRASTLLAALVASTVIALAVVLG